jgi:thiol-disulfide isomerase/thioredoxin
MKKKDLLLLLAIVTGLAGCSRTPASPTHAQPEVRAGELGSRLPDFAVKDFQGNDVSSTSLRGKVVLIDLWATWCQPCKKEMPGYQRLLDRYGSRGFAVVGLKSSVMMDTESPIKFAKEIDVHYPLASASADLVQRFGGMEGLPTTFLYDRHGILRDKVIGFEYTNHFEEKLKPLL